MQDLDLQNTAVIRGRIIMTPQEAAERIAGAFEAGMAPWSRSSRLRLTCGLPVDAWTGRPFWGINTWLLELAAIERGYRSRFWATRRQWEDLGAVVVRHAGTSILADLQLDQPASGDYVLFNLEQVEVRRGAPVAALERFWVAPKMLPDYALARSLVDAIGAKVVPDDRCHCVVHEDSSRDFIGMPALDFFHGDLNLYWSVLLHELTHWVVLGRNRLCWNGDDSQGELIAEVGAAILATHCGIPKTGELDVQGEHVQAWIRGIREDIGYLSHACEVAERAASNVLTRRGMGPVPGNLAYLDVLIDRLVVEK
jgi:antirestriction protein ArdC